MEMIWIAFFFLLRPGEYCSASDNQPLCMGHVTFTIGHQKLHTITASDADLHRATHVSLTFDDQKNRERGEVIGHARSGHSSACPVHALASRCITLRRAGGTAATPLCTYARGTRRSTLTSTDLTMVLRSSPLTPFPTSVFPPTTSTPAASGPAGPWPYFVVRSTPTPSVSSAAGNRTRCSSTCTPRLSPSV